MVKLIPIIFLSLFFISCSTNTDSLIKKAEKALSLEENDKAVKLLHKACKYENFKACNKIAEIYKQGNIVIIDYTKVDEYYRDSFNFSMKQCNKDSYKACRNLSYLYENGFGINQSYAKSDEYTLKACDVGDGYSCHKMGTYNYSNIDEYVKYTNQACNLKFSTACLDLGNMYMNGYNYGFINVTKKLDIALNYYNMACDISSSTCAQLGDIYISGVEIPQNYELANEYYGKTAKYYEELCENKNEMACMSLNVLKNKSAELN